MSRLLLLSGSFAGARAHSCAGASTQFCCCCRCLCSFLNLPLRLCPLQPGLLLMLGLCELLCPDLCAESLVLLHKKACSQPFCGGSSFACGLWALGWDKCQCDVWGVECVQGEGRGGNAAGWGGGADGAAAAQSGQARPAGRRGR